MPPDLQSRLLVLSNTYPPLELGGYELLCQQHVGWLRGRGHEVTVMTTKHGMRGRAYRETGPAGETVMRLLDFHWRAFQHRRPNLASVWAGERRQRLVLENVLADARPRAAFVWGMAGVSKSLLAVLHEHRVPIVAVVGEHWPIWDIDTDTWLRLWSRVPLPPASALASRLFAPTDVAEAMRAILPVYVSDHLRRTVEHHVPAWAGRGLVIHNGVDDRLFHRDRQPDEPVGQPVRLLYAGRVERRKGAHTAIEALAILRRQGVLAELTIVGWTDAVYEAELRVVAREAGIQEYVTWREAVPRPAMPDVYRAHDVLVFPTIWDEPFGLVPLEAMAAGCVVVATGTGGSGEYLLDGQSALRFQAENAPGLAECVARLVAEPDLVVRLRQGGWNQVQAHGFDAYAAALERLAVDGAGVG